MKFNLNLRYILFCLVLLSFTNCKGNKTYHINDTLVQGATTVHQKKDSNNNTDSVQLTALIKQLYKWRAVDSLKYDGFNPVKLNNTDTLYRGIDLAENAKAITELKATGFFTNGFLSNYHNIAVRMDKELRNGSSQWRDGDLPTFSNDINKWCNCQDEPVDNYWEIIKLTDIKIDHNKASFKWTWGDNFYYNVRALKENNTWEIDYLQGFDMNAYLWEWQKKHS